MSIELICLYLVGSGIFLVKPLFFSSSNSCRDTIFGFSPAAISTSALPILILSFCLAMLCRGGVVALEPSDGEVEPVLFEEADPPALPPPTAYSSFCIRAGVLRKSVARSNLTIELVGMLGVSFSKPPCM